MNNSGFNVFMRWVRLLCLAFVFTLASSVTAQTQQSAEYWIDSDPGLGQATSISLSGSMSVDGIAEAVTAIAADGLAVGQHLLGIRAIVFDEDGVPHYGPTLTQQFTIPDLPAHDAAFSCIEYFWDSDPGLGLATPLPTIEQDESGATVLCQIPTDGLAVGSHLLGFRAISFSGGVPHYGPTLTQTITIPDEVVHDAAFSSIEYFWDSDPGLGLATPLATTEQDESGATVLCAIPTDGLAVGSNHLLGIRAISVSGGIPRYGPTLTQTITIRPPKDDPSQLIVVTGEYFWNEDPGFGQGTPIAFTPGNVVNIADLAIPTFSVHGDATLHFRHRSAQGWSPTMSCIVLVDAEGHYTLNANAETSMEARNYQSLGDALGDFAARGISDDIFLTVATTGTDYALDATDDVTLGQIGDIAQNLEARSTNSNHTTIAFTAAVGSGNSLTVTTTDENMPAVVSLFAQTSLENVALTINGIAYDFTPASVRAEECCGTTTAVPLSAISNAVTASWQAQPHVGTLLSGFTAEGSGDIPAMEITNSGTQMDSLAYAVTLSDTDGRELYSYTYYIYVHSRMTNQAFTTFMPADGSSVDPVATQLEWNAFSDATGYRLVVTEAAEGAEPAEIVNTETTEPHYELTVQPGFTYTWTVTAIGHCDELMSEPQTLTGRLLPDLVVESIAMPEGVKAGTTIQVTATIRNQGEGATTEDVWTDRIYYVLDSSDFSNAVAATDVMHTGNVGAGGSYEVTFNMQVPYAESGTLRVFVTANADAAALESIIDNNRTLCTTAATLTPFYMDVSDLAALRQFYADFGGETWTGTKWNVGSELIAAGYWSGVSFDNEGHVTAISLENRGLTGSLSEATPLALPMLTSLNVSRNALTGDPAVCVTTEGLPLLTTLDMSYNRIDDLSSPLPASIGTLVLTYQHRTYNKTAQLQGLEDADPLTVAPGSQMEFSIPAIATYSHTAQSFSTRPTLNVYKTGMSTRYGQMTWSSTYDCYAWTSNGSTMASCQQDENIFVVPTSGTWANSAFAARMHLMLGDVNMSGWVDVNDVQATLNNIISGTTTKFSRWAANTWDADDIINIQDIVCTVNIVLDDQGDGSGAQGAPRRNSRAAANNNFYAANHYICLDAQDSIAAFDVEVDGVKATQVKLLLNKNDWQMLTRETEHGVRLVVFSPTGQTLPTGQTRILRMSAEGNPVAVQATSAAAESVNVGINSFATGISGDPQYDNPEHDSATYDLGGRKVKNDKSSGQKLPHSVYIQNGKKITR